MYVRGREGEAHPSCPAHEEGKMSRRELQDFLPPPCPSSFFLLACPPPSYSTRTPHHTRAYCTPHPPVHGTGFYPSGGARVITTNGQEP